MAIPALAAAVVAALPLAIAGLHSMENKEILLAHLSAKWENYVKAFVLGFGLNKLNHPIAKPLMIALAIEVLTAYFPEASRLQGLTPAIAAVLA